MSDPAELLPPDADCSYTFSDNSVLKNGEVFHSGAPALESPGRETELRMCCSPAILSLVEGVADGIFLGVNNGGIEGDEEDSIADISFISGAPETILECAETTAALLGSGVEISTAASRDKMMAAVGALQGEQLPDGAGLGIPADGKAGAQLPEMDAFA